MNINHQNNVIKITQNRFKTLFFLLLGVITSLVMLFAFFSKLPKIEAFIILGIALLSIYVFSIALKNFIGGKKEALIISEEGISDYSTKNIFSIKWQDIESLKSLPKSKQILITCRKGKGQRIKNIFTKKIQIIDNYSLESSLFRIKFQDLENILFEKFKKNIKSYQILKNKNKYIIISLDKNRD